MWTIKEANFDHNDFIRGFMKKITNTFWLRTTYDLAEPPPEILIARVYLVVQSAEGRLEPEIAPRSG